ncbi:lamin tail domain-containing protein [Halosimplex amylolyticum]|uniref:lamin tail domain-containing protein n=1 Tax=Halosimplex amylolyticum TaxID=3396616 RepID=UPI003F561EF3
MSRGHPYTTAVVVVLVVFAGCTGVVENNPGQPATDRPETAASDSPATEVTTASSPSQSSDNSTATVIGTASVNGTVEVHFINVGQSVSTLIVGPTNETMLIDSGDFRDDGEYVLQYLDQHDIDRIDHFVTTHADADHIGGNAAIIDYFETEADGIGAVYDPGIAASTQTYEEYLDAVEAHNVTLYETREGDPLPFEGVEVEVLGPPEPYLENRDRNENSIVLQLSYGNTSFLFTGDAEDDQEAYLVDTYGTALQSTILKAGHHGSASSTSGAILDAVDPKAVVISSAYDSQYGHPHEEVLQRLAARSIPAYWTATHGNTVLASNGTHVVVKTQQAAPTDPTELRTGSSIEPGATSSVETRMTIVGSGNGPTQTPVATDGGTETPSDDGSLVVDEIHADAEGDERENLNDEYVVFRNTGPEPLDLSGWTVADAADHTYTFPDGFTLDTDATVTLHTGSGTDSNTDLYWGSGSPIWNNDGDTVIVTNHEGDEVLREEYS